MALVKNERKFPTEENYFKCLNFSFKETRRIIRKYNIMRQEYLNNENEDGHLYNDNRRNQICKNKASNILMVSIMRYYFYNYIYFVINIVHHFLTYVTDPIYY